ncbi:MAG: hypothetical protein MHM6MM_004517 [Cercozoa sp. M6MM]
MVDVGDSHMPSGLSHRQRHQRQVESTEKSSDNNVMTTVETKPETTAEKKHTFVGVDIDALPDVAKLAVLGGAVLVCGFMFAALQESVTKVEGFRFPGWMSFLTAISFAACAFVEARMDGHVDRRASKTDYALLSLLAMASMESTNLALNYVNYATRLIFKSAKLLPTMAINVLFVGRRYMPLEYINFVVLAFGVLAFAIGDMRASPSFSLVGLLLLLGGLLGDALLANIEERHFFRKHKCHHGEVMLWSYLFGACLSLPLLLWRGELLPAVEHSIAHPEVVFRACGAAVLGYAGIGATMLVIKRFGAANAEALKSARKLLSIAFSLLFYKKPVTKWHAAGLVLFLLSVSLGIAVKALKQRQLQASVNSAALRELEAEKLKKSK